MSLSPRLLALLVAVPLVAQPAAPLLTGAQIRSDARRFLQMLEATHPDPYSSRGGKVAFKRQAQQLLDALPEKGLSAEALADRLNLFLAPMRDGHSQIQGVSNRFKDPAPWLPLSFGVVSDGLYLQATELDGLRDCLGHRLVGVEGRPPEALIEALPFRSENEHGDRQRLANVLRSRKLMALALPEVATRDTVTFRLQDSAGRTFERAVPWSAVSPRKDPASWTRQPLTWDGLPARKDEFWGQILGTSGVGYLRIGTMVGRDAFEVARREKIGHVPSLMAMYFKSLGKEVPADPEEALRTLPSLFETAHQLLSDMRERRVQDLVIDLRGNTGGFTPIVYPLLYLMYGDEAYGHRFGSQFIKVASDLLLKKQQCTLETFRKKVGDPDLELGDYVFPSPGAMQASPEEARRSRLADYRAKGYPWTGALEALAGKPLWKPRRVLVLCDAVTFSAGFHAMTYLREFGAQTVGVPSSQSPNAFMEGTEFELPESKLKGMFSNSVQSFLPEDLQATVFPVDHPLTYAQAKAYGFDTQAALRLALDLLRRPPVQVRSAR